MKNNETKRNVEKTKYNKHDETYRIKLIEMRKEIIYASLY